MLHSAQEVYNYSGIYISYSLSSSSNALKVGTNIHIYTGNPPVLGGISF